MKAGDRVVLTCAPWSGSIERVRKDGRIDVALDGGGKALGMGQDDLRDEPVQEVGHLDEEKVREEEVESAGFKRSDKSWPPKGLETKVPKVAGAK